MSLDILFREQDKLNVEPKFFVDLNLDQIVSDIVKPEKDFDLRGDYYTPLNSKENIIKRQEVFKDLENNFLEIESIQFSVDLIAVEKIIKDVDVIGLGPVTKGRFFACIQDYFKIVERYYDSLNKTLINSFALKEVLKYLKELTSGDEYNRFKDDTIAIAKELKSINYYMLMKDGAFIFKKDLNLPDYSIAINDLLSRFSNTSPNYTKEKLISESVESNLLLVLEDLYPNEFKHFEDYLLKYTKFMDLNLSNIAYQLKFYLAYMNYIGSLKDNGLEFCYPTIIDSNKISCTNGFDLALAKRLNKIGDNVVTNSYFYSDNDRICVISGPNQGGKTTFARAFGQINYLALLGVPVTGSKASVVNFNNIFTHFASKENMVNEAGKFKEELIKMHDIVCNVKANDLVIINEIFSSTALVDAITISKMILEKLVKKNAIVLFITFMDELSKMESAYSMVSLIVPSHPELRTFKIERKEADGLAYANAIVAKHHLSYNDIRRRMK